MSTEKQKNVLVALAPYSDAVKELLAVQGKRDDLEILEAKSPDEAVMLIATNLPCMFVGSVVDNQGIPGVVNTLKRSDSGIKYGRLKTLVISKIKNKQLSKLVSSLGVTDYMEEPVPARTLVFKSNVQIKAVESVRKIEEGKKKASEKVVFKTDAEAAAGAAGAQPANSKLKPALQVENDMFLFKNGAAKKAGKKFMLELEGPDPASGAWVQHEDKGEAKSAWRWVPNDEKDKPETKNGDGWVHEGDKPVFNPNSKKWQMASEKPDLSYQKDKKKTATKVATNAEGELEVAEDSPKAESNLKAITAKWNPAALKAEEAKGANPLQESAPEESKSNLNSMNLVSAEPKGPGLQDKTGGSAEVKASKDLSYTGSTLPESKELKLESQEEKESDSPELTLKNRKKKPSKNPGKAEADESTEDPTVESKKTASTESANPQPEEKTNPALAFLQKKQSEAQKAKEKAPAEKWEESKGEFRNKTGGPSEPLVGAKDKRKATREDQEIASSKEKERPARDPGESKADRLKKLLASMDDEDDSEASEKEDQDSLRSEKKKKKGEGAKGGLLALKEKLLKEKKQLTQQLTEELSKPIPETISPEEEAEARAELGITDPNVSQKELARKKKFNKLKRMKDKLKDFDSDLTDVQEEAERPEPKIHDLKAEDPENTWSEKDLAAQASTGRKLNAYDSEVSEEELAEQEKKKFAERAAKKSREGTVEEPEFWRKESEILPLGGAWETTGFHFVYLDALTRYKGFTTVESLLPLWIYEGERVPELIAKRKEWRFYSREPVHAKEISQVPIGVVDYLNALNEQIKKGEGKKNAEKPDRAAALKEKLRDTAPSDADDTRDDEPGDSNAPTSSEDATPEERTKPRNMAEVAAESEERKKTLKEKVAAGKAGFADIEKKKKDRDAASKEDRLAALKARMGAGEDGRSAQEDEAESQEKETKTDDSSTEEIGLASEKKKKDRDGASKEDRLAALKARMGAGEDDRSAQEDEAESQEKETKADDSSTEEIGLASEKKKKDRGAASKEDRLAAMKKRLGDDGSGEDVDSESQPENEKAAESSDTEESAAPKEKRDRNKEQKEDRLAALREKLGANELKQEPEASTEEKNPAAKVEDALSGQSPAMKKFFERRKQKAAEAKPVADAVIANKPRDPGGPVAFLGIYVALSDAVYANREFPRTAVRMARAVSGTIENTFVTFARRVNLEGSDATVMGSSNPQHPLDSVMDVTAAPRISIALKTGAGDLLGWMVIEPIPPRTELTPNETDALNKTGAKVAQLWEARENEETKKEKSAA